MSKKNITVKRVFVTVISVFAIAVVILPIVVIVLHLFLRLEYLIKSAKGHYPGERKLGDCIWTYRDDEIEIDLTFIDGKIVGEITSNEKLYNIRGKTLYDQLYLHYIKPGENFEEVYDSTLDMIIEARYEYVDGVIKCTEVKPKGGYLNFKKDFTLTKEKSINKTLTQKWKCEETSFQLLTYDELDNYAIIEYNDENYALIKEFDNYFCLELTASYEIYGTLERTEDKIEFRFLGKEVVTTIPEDLLFLEDMDILTFHRLTDKIATSEGLLPFRETKSLSRQIGSTTGYVPTKTGDGSTT